MKSLELWAANMAEEEVNQLLEKSGVRAEVWRKVGGRAARVSGWGDIGAVEGRPQGHS